MTKDEYVKTLEKYMADNELEQEDGLTYLDGIQEAAVLARQLDEPKKVIIPQFVDDWIKEYSKDFAPLGIVHQILNRSLEKGVQNHWRNDEDNQKLLLNAIANGYEVEKEPKYKVRIKGFNGLDCTKYVNYHMPDNIFLLNDRIQTKKSKTSFTKQWLKDNWPEYDAYNNAGLLEFEEVEDD